MNCPCPKNGWRHYSIRWPLYRRSSPHANWKFTTSRRFSVRAWIYVFSTMIRRTFEQENLYTLSKHSEEFKNKVCQTVLVLNTSILHILRFRIFQMHSVFPLWLFPGSGSHWERRREIYLLRGAQMLQRVSGHRWDNILSIAWWQL